jgi:hypothetical protein
MKSLVANAVIALTTLFFAFGGALLAMYAEADDSPGGVLIGMVIIIGAVVLGVRAVLRRR